MFSAKLIAFLISLRAIIVPCCPPSDKEQLTHQVYRYARMDKMLMESSGLEYAGDGTFWTILDSGGPAALYRIASDGSLQETIPLDLPNYDWEDLARDWEGNLYIGDVGNNLSRRKDLRIFKLNRKSGQIDTIRFQWEGQEEFPPDKGEQNYDCEAFIWFQGQLHLFTKSRGDKMVRHFVVPDSPGDYTARLVESVYLSDLVTAADISPDKSTLALLTYGKVFLFGVDGPEAMLQRSISCLRVPWAGQSESIVFVSNNSLVLGNETGKLFYMELYK